VHATDKILFRTLFFLAGTLLLVAPSFGGPYSPKVTTVFFAYPNGVQSQKVDFDNNSAIFYGAVYSSTNGWLTGPTSGLLTDGLLLSVNQTVASALPTGSYVGTVTLNDGSVITVYLTVNASNSNFSPPSLTFNAPLGGPPQSQVVTVSNATSIQYPGDCESWMGVAQNGVNSYQITVYPGALSAAGVYSCVIDFGAPGKFPVTLNLGSSSGGGTTSGTFVAPQSLNFSYPTGGDPPPAQYLSVVSTGAISVSTGYPSGGPQFISVNSNTGEAGLVSVSVVGGLGQGTYVGSVIVATDSGVQSVTVTLNVTQAGVTIAADPGSLNLRWTSGQGPVTRRLLLSTSDGSAVSVGLSSSVAWVVPSQTSVVTPANLNVMIDPSALPNGFNTATITVTSSSLTNSPLVIPVIAVVSGSLSGGNSTLTVNPASLTFTYTQGGNLPAVQKIDVSSASGSASIGITATVTSGSDWLTVTPQTAATKVTLSVKADPSRLQAGAYSGNIRITPDSGNFLDIPVSLTVQVQPQPVISSAVNAASFATSTAAQVSPGEMITIFGTNLGPATPAPLTAAALDPNGNLPTKLGGVEVLIGGYNAPMIYASDKQVSAVVPYDIAPPRTPPNLSVQVKYLGLASAEYPVTLAATLPGIFSADGSGTGPGAIVNPDGSLNSPAHPANKGDIVTLYVTGEGQTNPPGVTGKITAVNQTGSGPLTPQPVLPVAVRIDGQAATVKFYGEAPGIVAGVMQVNVEIPSTARSGQLPIVVQVGSVSSQGSVTVSVR
jgi:uncharacterized protein (TIGR03437 family)